MERTRLSLEQWKSIASIVSALALPLVIAIVGYLLQKQMSDEGIRKDYVSIASNILGSEMASADPELREWAVAVLARYSPVPFSEGAKEGLGAVYISARVPKLPDVARQPEQDALCQPSCGAGLRAKNEEWLGRLQKSRSVEELTYVISDAMDVAQAFALAADISRASGNACVAVYEVISSDLGTIPNDTATTERKPPPR